MKQIKFTMPIDEDGKITVTNTLKYIMQNVPQIKVPDADITKMSLTALMLADDDSKKCVNGYAEGTVWGDGIYTEYMFTLNFA